MAKDFHIEYLKQSHLILIQKHIALGREHLRSLLDRDEIRELCSKDLLDPAAESEVRASPVEFAGTFTRSLNSILTTVLSIWVGLKGSIRFYLKSKFMFQSIMGFSVALGGLIGIWNFRFTKKEIEKRIEERQLQDIQLYILEFLISKREEQFKLKRAQIDDLLKKMGMARAGLQQKIGMGERFIDPGLSGQWLSDIENRIEKEGKHSELYSFFAEEIESIKNGLKKQLGIDSLEKENKKKIPSILAPLIQTPLPATKKKQGWIRKNGKEVLIGAIPLLYATSTALYSFLNNASSISKEVKWESLHSFLTNPQVKKGELIFTVGAALYFVAAFAMGNRKNFYRDQEIEKTQEKIIQKEGALSKLDDHLLKIQEIFISIHRLYKVFEMLKKINPLVRNSIPEGRASVEETGLSSK